MPLRTSTLVCALLALLALTAAARNADASETVYWDNYGAGSLAFANLDGTGGGALSLGEAELSEPEGIALDVAGGRLFAPSRGGESQIVFARIDGSGGGVLNTAPGTVESPEGVAIDPTTGTIYWANTVNTLTNHGSIGWAKLDGSVGGLLNTAGSSIEDPYKVGIDVVHRRIYWSNNGGTGQTISYANLDGSGGGDLDTTGASAVAPTGFAVDPAAGRVYWVNNENSAEYISYADINGGGGGDLNPTGSVFASPYGLAFDPSIGRFYWGNYNSSTTSGATAIGFGDLSGTGGAIDIVAAPVDGPQDPVVFKAPIAAGAPTVTPTGPEPSLSCSQGTWASYPGSYVYAEPTGYAYQWTSNGTPISGATASTIVATAPGAYACTVTATNQQGSTAQSSAGSTAVEAASLKLVVKTRKARAKAGRKATFKVQALNQGDLPAAGRLCVKLPKKARKALKAGKCAALGSLAAEGSKVAKLTVRVGRKAKGTYKLKIVAKGVAAKPAKVRLQVLPLVG